MSEVEVILKLVGVGIILTVEVFENEPVRCKELLRGTHADCAEKILLKLKVCDAVLLARTDIIELSPEILGNGILADICKKKSRILDSCPLKNAVDGNVEHYRVNVLEDARIKDT